MDKLSKIFLVIIIILIIILGIMTFINFHIDSLLDRCIGSIEQSVNLIKERDIAIEKSGLKIDKKEDGSYTLVKKIQNN